jgi:hypothetical protein
MTVTVASFRASLPEFANQGQYPTGVIQYWLALAAVLLGTGSGSPPKVCSFTGSLAANKVLTVSEIDFGSLSLFPLLLEGENLPNDAAVLGQLTGAPSALGTYQCSVAGAIPAEPMVALQTGFNTGVNNFWGPASLTADYPPTTVADIATQMWVAHQVVLEKQALAAAATGGDPGTKIGIISNKSVNGASMGFDVGTIAGGKMQENAGYYNQTVYGMRFYRLMKLRGAGPIQIGIGIAPPFLIFNSGGFLGSSNAWVGPSPLFPQQGDTGF